MNTQEHSDQSEESPDSSRLKEAFDYCAAQLRLYDSDRYFSCLLAPPEHRRALVALFAFNLEIAKTRESVSEPMLGHIRLQWWRDSLDGIADGTPRSHAVVTALAEILTGKGAVRSLLREMIDARDTDLEEEPIPSLDDLVRYCSATSGTLNAAALKLLDAETESLTAGRDAGVAYALVGLVRAVPHLAGTGRSVLPGVTAGEIIPASDRVKKIVRDMTGLAKEYRQAAGHGLASLSRSERPACLPAATCRADIVRIEKAGFDPFVFKDRGRLARHAAMLSSYLSGRF